MAEGWQGPRERGVGMARRLKVGALTGFLLVVVAALVVVTGGAAQATKVKKVGFASPEKPNDYGWNQQGYLGAKAAPKVAQEFKVPVVVWDAKGGKPGLVSNVITAAQQGAYLAGLLAAKVTKTGTLGIVVSASDETWYKQAGGFVQGARSVNKNLK